MRFVVIYLVLAIIIYVRGICPVIHDRRKRLWCLFAVLPLSLIHISEPTRPY